ncbi:PatB family C-S lyase [uncultured Sanguibacteroides sp.]|uniref:MalY/PatB family protein n=1 Tax=uncultured Sanguibacteroides sp. TaxID=1635151 RepID=UPI0025E65529|nr:PatB family C-S lyase [uncultured Sanguibacteroides sp.]
MYNFDRIIDRHHTDCVKYDNLNEVFGRTDLLPMWVADMDFQSPPEVIEAARKCCDNGIFGYSFRSGNAKQAFIEWVARRHQWDVKEEWLLSSPGIVTALSLGVRVYTKEKEKVMIFTPVYPPFHSVVTDNGRELICSSLIIENSRYCIDWEDFEKKIKSGVKLLILSNPHNPVGRVWTKEELLRIGKTCYENGVIILSDEIHSDLALFGHKHIAVASLADEIASLTVTMMAPSKTFNIAGMMNSVIVISSEKLRRIFKQELEHLHLDLGNLFGHVTLEAAYRSGEKWLEELLSYLENNIRYTEQFIREQLPGLHMLPPEGSFLLWIDFRETGVSHEEIGKRLLEKARLALNNGTDFGPEGLGFRRMNIGCPLSVVQEGLERLKQMF